MTTTSKLSELDKLAITYAAMHGGEVKRATDYNVFVSWWFVEGNGKSARASEIHTAVLGWLRECGYIDTHRLLVSEMWK